MTFSARLALVRNRMGWNAKEAALACGLPAQSWRNWEQGVRPHNYPEVCQLIADRTGCEASWLFGITPSGGTEVTSRGTTHQKVADRDPAVRPVAA